MKSRTGIHSTRALLGVFAVVVLMVAGVSASAADTRAPKLALSEPARVSEKLGCSQHVLFYDDIYFHDRMTGVVCFLTDSSTMFFHVYEQEKSVLQVVSRWDYYLTRENRIVLGDNWFAIGTEEHLSHLEEVLGIDPVSPVQSVDGEPVPLTAEEDFIGDCSAFTAIAIKNAIFDSKQYEETIDYYNTMFPGMVDVVRTVVPQLKNDSALAEDLADAAVSFFGSTIKSFCRTLAPKE